MGQVVVGPGYVVQQLLDLALVENSKFRLGHLRRSNPVDYVLGQHVPLDSLSDSLPQQTVMVMHRLRCQPLVKELGVVTLDMSGPLDSSVWYLKGTLSESS